MAIHIPSRSTPDSPAAERTPLEQRLEGLDGSHAAAPQLSFMLAGAQWRDSWLHGFRSLYLVMEVILLGLAGGLLVSILNLDVKRAWVPAVLLVVDAVGSLFLLARMRRAALGLGRFKLLQHSRNHADTDDLAALALAPEGLDEVGLDRLVEPFSSSATRRLIENRVPAVIAVLWISWVIAGVGALYLRAGGIIP